MMKQPIKPNHTITILFPPTSILTKDTTPKTEYGLANTRNKPKHKIQK